MKNEIKAITPEAAELSLAVLSGPRGMVQDNWSCICYTVQVSHRRNIVYAGDFKLGIGHVKFIPYGKMSGKMGVLCSRLTADEENCSNLLAMGKTLKKTPEILALQANTAAKLAIIQKVSPSLNRVVHSLIFDGAAFFDGQRFEEWASDLGYSSDSIKAKETFEACDRIGRDLARSLSRDELEGLREWASNY